MGSTKKPKHEPSPRCTACDKDLKMAKDGEVKTHALLDVLVCLKCSENYGDGDFTKYDNGVDEEGDDNYCRWCADGGELLVCCESNCHYAYCKKCIKRNLGRKIYGKISDSEDWHCFACDKSQIEIWINYAKEFIAKLQLSEKENEKPIPATPEVTITEPSEPPKTSLLITPSVDTSFTSSARKKEARAKKSTAKPTRIFDENKEDDDTKSDDKVDDNMSEASENKAEDVEKDREKEEKEKEKQIVEKMDTDKEKELEVTQELKPEADESLNVTQKTSTPSRQSSPRRVSKMFSDVVVEESDGDQQKTPKRKLCDDVVIEDEDEIVESQKMKKEATVEKNTPKPKLADVTVLSTTIEKASDDSGDEVSIDSKRKTKNVPISDTKKRRMTRSSVAGVNGDAKVSEVNSLVNILIQETNEINTEYFKILSQMRDSNEINEELQEKFKRISDKILLKITENVWTVRGMSH